MAQQDILSTDTLPQGRTKLNANSAEVQAHVDNTSNPHAVTAAQVGAMTEAETRPALNAKQAAGGVWFDGETGSADIPFIAVSGKTITFVFSVKTSETNTGLNLLSSTGSDGGYGIYLRNGVPAFLARRSDNTNHCLKLATGNYSDGKWHTVAFVVDAADPTAVDCTFYIDGAVTSSSYSITPNGTYADPTGVSISEIFDVSEQYGRGVFIFNRALSAAEVATLYDHGGALPAGPEWRWGQSIDLLTGVVASNYDNFSSFTGTSGGFDATASGAARAIIPFGRLYSSDEHLGVTFRITGTVHSISGSVSLFLTTDSTGSGVTLDSPITMAFGDFDLTFKTNGTLADLYGVMFLMDNGESLSITVNSLQILGAIASLPMDEGAGPVLHDVSPNGNHATLSGGYKHLIPNTQTETIAIAVGDETTDLTTGTGKTTFRMPYGFQLYAVRASVTTAPDGSALQVDVNGGGTSIFSTVLSIDASEKTSTTAATAAVLSTVDLADDEEITIDIDQVGSTTAGAGLKVYFIGRRTS